MTTLVDQLIVRLDLDPAKLDESRKRAAESIVRMKEDAAKQGKQVEGKNEQILEGFKVVQRNVLLLATLFTGGVGIKEFIKNTTQVSNALGNLAPQLKTSATNLGLWGAASQSIGGNANSIVNAIGNLTNDLATFSLTGESKVVPVLRALTDSTGAMAVKVTEANGKMRDTTDILLDLAEWAHQQSDPARAAAVLRMLGFDQDGINLMLKGKDALKKTMEDLRKVNELTEEDVKAARELTASWNAMSIASEQLGRSLLTGLAPMLTWLMDSMTGAAERIKKSIKSQNETSTRFEALPWSERARMSWQETIHPGSTPLSGMVPWPDLRAPGGGAPAPGGASSGGADRNDKAPTPAVLENAVKLLRSGGSTGDLQRFMQQQGYPMSGAWCGQFAASVVKSYGGTPPKGAAIASNWRTWGTGVETPKPGDVAVRNGAPTGSTGSHVGFVTKVYPDGSFDMVGGNQGRAVAHHAPGTYSFRRGVEADDLAAGKKESAPFLPNPAPNVPWLNRMPTEKVNNRTDHIYIDKLEVDAPNATDATGIARDIGGAIKDHGLVGAP